jgi:hypothetical protein
MTIGTAFSGRSGKPTTCTLRLVGRHHVALADSAVLQVQLQTGFKTDFAVFDSQYRLPRAVHRDQSSLIPLEPEASSKRLWRFLPASVTSKKAWASRL